MKKSKEWEKLVNSGFSMQQADALMEVFGRKKPATDTEINKNLWEVYREAYFARWKTDPVRNATVNKQISMLVARLGQDAAEVVKFYLKHNKGWYVEKCHPIGLCLADAEALRTQWARGKAITKNDVRAFEQGDAFRSQMERIERGEL